MDHEKDALEPTFALLEKVAEVKWGFLPHFSFYKVEVVALTVGAHCEETVLRYGTVKAIVEGYCLFGRHLKTNVKYIALF